MRDRLIELINGFEELDFCIPPDWWIEHFADHLLANGVVVLPCKVGDTVWFPSQYYDRPYPFIITKIEIYEEETIIYSEGDSGWHYEDIGKTVFLTREEAERALKGGAE